jgi:hypothetical protein
MICLGRSTAEQRELCLEFSVPERQHQVASRALMRKGPVR